MADYKTIRGTATFEYEEKRSRFIATASFADTFQVAPRSDDDSLAFGWQVKLVINPGQDLFSFRHPALAGIAFSQSAHGRFHDPVAALL